MRSDSPLTHPAPTASCCSGRSQRCDHLMLTYLCLSVGGRLAAHSRVPGAVGFALAQQRPAALGGHQSGLGQSQLLVPVGCIGSDWAIRISRACWCDGRFAGQSVLLVGVPWLQQPAVPSIAAGHSDVWKPRAAAGAGRGPVWAGGQRSHCARLSRAWPLGQAAFSV